MSDYYKFGNVQVLDISRHLTSNAGQAVQYIARSCRLDGNNKGEVEADLRKAIDFLKDELDRISASEHNSDWFKDAAMGTEVTSPDGAIWRKGAWGGWDIVGPESRVGWSDNDGMAERFRR